MAKVGSGLLALTSSNSYSGPTTLAGGTLQVGANTSMELPSNTYNLQNGANLVFWANNNTGTPSLTIGGTGNVTFLGESNGLIKTDSANFSYSGTTTVALDPVSGGSNAASASTIYVEGGAAHGLSSSASLNLISGRVLFAQNQTLTGLSGTGGTIACDDPLHPTSGSATLMVDIPSGVTDSYSGTIMQDPIAGHTGTLSLTVSGNGYLYLTGTNTYTGGTYIATGGNASFVEAKYPASLPGYSTSGVVTVDNYSTLCWRWAVPTIGRSPTSTRSFKT